MVLVALVLIGTSAATVSAQNPFEDPIPKSSVRLLVEEFAVIPDSGTGSAAPPRINLMTSDPQGRLFANDQRGKLFQISADGSTVTEYLDISNFNGVDLRTASGEQGFQSFAFHPDFHEQGSAGFGKLYTIHSSDNNTPTPDFDPGGTNEFHTVLMEWNVGDPSSDSYSAGGGTAPREVMRLQQPFSNHNAGQIAFNPTAGNGGDRGNLYIGIGDSGSGGDPQENAQDLGNPYGAILRINPLADDSTGSRYTVTQDNLFASDNDNSTLAEIFAYGLRNPQRFTWDPLTGDMLIGDIGQDAIEEINLGLNGANYGWDQREGSLPFEGAATPDMVDPIAEYDHTDSIIDPATTVPNRAITVGDVIRGSGVAALDGLLIFGDFPTGAVFALDVDNDPFDGGQDGIFELDLVDASGASIQFLDLINATRQANGLAASARADLRFSFGIEGQWFLTNKHDGIIRTLTAIPEPQLALCGVMVLGVFFRRGQRLETRPGEVTRPHRQG